MRRARTSGTVAQHSAAVQRPAVADIIRRATLGTAIGLLIQYALGMWVSLYVTVPAREHGGGVAAAIGRALSGGPAALAVHAGIGLLLLVGSIVLVVRAALARVPFFIVTSSVNLIAVAGAAASGAAFVNAGRTGASLDMALLTGVALLCQVLNLYWLGSGRPSGG
ncbi:MAG TPA: hypothetical protein VMV92_11015 [Streptosporangiaceae bacterium]|nr:hypothetical protein [Streptosporangiaceae bacterium]